MCCFKTPPPPVLCHCDAVTAIPFQPLGGGMRTGPTCCLCSLRLSGHDCKKPSRAGPTYHR